MVELSMAEVGEAGKDNSEVSNAATRRDGELVGAGRRFAQWNGRRTRKERWKAKENGSRRQRRGRGHFARRKRAWQMQGRWRQTAWMFARREAIKMVVSVMVVGYESCEEGDDENWEEVEMQRGSVMTSNDKRSE